MPSMRYYYLHEFMIFVSITNYFVVINIINILLNNNCVWINMNTNLNMSSILIHDHQLLV
jgi:hypothetical protein